MVFTSKHNMEYPKSEKLLKKKEINFFFWYFLIWRNSRKGMVQNISNVHFQQFFQSSFQSVRKSDWKFQVNLGSSFGDISKNPKGRACFSPQVKGLKR